MRASRMPLVPEALGAVAGAGAGVILAVAAAAELTTWSAVLPVAVVAAVVVATGVRGRRGARITAQRQERQVAKLRSRLDGVAAAARAAQETAALSAMPVPFPLPMSSFALGYEAAAVLARDVAVNRPEVVVELGSGTSSMVIGMQLARSGAGHCYSLEHDPAYAALTRRHLAAMDLQAVVTVLDAPLVSREVDGHTYTWYEVPDVVAALPHIDLLLVDGPPQATERDGMPRYPALSAFRHQLDGESRVYVDDASRDAERRMLEQWLAQDPTLAVERIRTQHGLAILRPSA